MCVSAVCIMGVYENSELYEMCALCLPVPIYASVPLCFTPRACHHENATPRRTCVSNSNHPAMHEHRVLYKIAQHCPA